MGIREDVVDMKKQLDEVKQESVALELVRDFKKANKRMFIIIIVALSMWFITISYLVYVLNDIGSMEITQENEDGYNNYIGNDGEINNG